MSKRQKLEELFADRHFDGDVIILCAMSPRRKRSSAGQSNIKASHRKPSRSTDTQRRIARCAR